MKKNALFLTMAALLLSACSFQSSVTPAPTPKATGTATTTPTGTVKTKSITLYEQNQSKESGTALLEEEGGKLKVTLSLVGGPTTESQPAHIHTGKCPTPGAVKYSLTNVIRGESVTVLDLTLAQLTAMGDLAINVHKSTIQSDVYVACGDIK